MRAGHYVKQATGYAAFIPALLPPDPTIKIDAELSRDLSEADRAVGRLDGIATVLPNPDLFVSMYVRGNLKVELAIHECSRNSVEIRF